MTDDPIPALPRPPEPPAGWPTHKHRARIRRRRRGRHKPTHTTEQKEPLWLT